MPYPDPYLEPVAVFPPYHVELSAKGCSYGGGFIALATPRQLVRRNDSSFGAQRFDSVEEALQFVGASREALSPTGYYYYRIVDADGDVAWSDQPKPEPAEPALPPSYKVSAAEGRPSIAIVAASLTEAPTVDIRLGRPVANDIGQNRHPDLDSLETGAGLGADSDGFFFRLGREAANDLAKALIEATCDAEDIADANV